MPIDLDSLDDAPRGIDLDSLDDAPKQRGINLDSLDDAPKQEGPSLYGAGKQFLIGAGNSFAFGVPELFFKKQFEEFESPHQAERIARGVGTTVGAVVGAPGLVFKVGSKIATKALVKQAPKLIRLAELAGKAKKGTELAKAARNAAIAKAAIEGAGGAVAYNIVDPSKSIQDKITSTPQEAIGGAVVGAVFHVVPEAIKSAIKKEKNVSQSAKKTINEAVSNPVAFDLQGKPVQVSVDPRTKLVPSIDRQIPTQLKQVLENLLKKETEIEAAKRGLVSFAEQRSNAIKKPQIDQWHKEWTPGTTVNTETMWGLRFDLRDDLLNIAKTGNKETINNAVEKAIRVSSAASETGRTLGGLRSNETISAEQAKLIADGIMKLPDKNAQEAARKLLNSFSAPTFWDKFMELRTASLLTSPFTHMRNLVGNTIPRIYNPTEKLVAGGVDKVRSLVTGKERSRFAREALGDVVGVVHGFKPAMRNAINAFLDENFVSDSKVFEAVRHRQAIGGISGKVIRTPFRALSALDELFVTLGHSASLYSQATRQAIKENAKDIPLRVAELVKNPSIDMISKAAKASEEDTFRQALGPAASHIQSALLDNNLFSRGARFIVPFFKTPINLFKWTYHRGPTSILSTTNWKAIMKGTAEEQADAIAKIALGQAITAGIALQAMDGGLTGRLSGDRGKQENLLRQGMQPYSVRIGDKFVSYRSFEPLSSWLALVSNAVENYKEEGKIDGESISKITMETVKMMKDQSFLKGISDLTNAMDDPERYGERFRQNMITSIIPGVTGLSYIARLYDPIVRDPGSIPDAIKAKLPYFSKGVAPKLDVWGRPITKEGTFSQRAFLPSGVTTLKPDLTENELLLLEKFPRKITEKYKGLDLSVQERNEVTAVEGKIGKELLDQLVQTPQYQSMPPWEQGAALDSLLSKVRENVRAVMLTPKILKQIRDEQDPTRKAELLEEFTRKKILKPQTEGTGQ